MDMLFNINWHSMFVPSNSILEMIIRGTATYLALFLLLRVVLKRETGGTSITDVLVIVLLADAAQNAMAGEYTSITEGLTLVGTIVFWSAFLDWLSFKSKFFANIIKPGKLLLVRDGELVLRNMRKELITHEELMSEIRQNNCASIKEVKAAYMEPDGRISVILKE